MAHRSHCVGWAIDRSQLIADRGLLTVLRGRLVDLERTLFRLAASYFAERHAPFDRLAVDSLDDAVHLQLVCTCTNLEMRRNVIGGADDAKAFRGAPEREAVPPCGMRVRRVGSIDDTRVEA